jgi:hypothetical protein
MYIKDDQKSLFTEESEKTESPQKSEIHQKSGVLPKPEEQKIAMETIQSLPSNLKEKKIERIVIFYSDKTFIDYCPN